MTNEQVIELIRNQIALLEEAEAEAARKGSYSYSEYWSGLATGYSASIISLELLIENLETKGK